MRVYLVQHGVPVPKEKDPDRPLSERGRDDVTRTAAALARAGVKVDAVFHSGKARAEQTAVLLAEQICPDKTVQRREGLAPLDEVGPVAGFLEGGTGDVMLVGHLPHMGKLASLLTAGREDAGIVAFGQGAVCCLERGGEGGWSISWMIVPDMAT